MAKKPRRIKIYNTPRSVDDLHLEILQMRCRMAGDLVGLYFGMTGARVRSICGRILKDDQELSGELPHIVRRSYWR